MQIRPKPGTRSLRKGRASIPKQTYLITTVCHGRQPRFADWKAAHTASASLTEHSLWRTSRLLCWVLMPDHLHLLVQLAETESLSRLMQRVKAVTARAVNSLPGPSAGALWARGYHDHALRAEEDLLRVARYVIANPLRARLVDQIGHYPYWDAIWLTGPADIL